MSRFFFLHLGGGVFQQVLGFSGKAHQELVLFLLAQLLKDIRILVQGQGQGIVVLFDLLFFRMVGP